MTTSSCLSLQWGEEVVVFLTCSWRSTIGTSATVRVKNALVMVALSRRFTGDWTDPLVLRLRCARNQDMRTAAHAQTSYLHDITRYYRVNCSTAPNAETLLLSQQGNADTYLNPQEETAARTVEILRAGRVDIPQQRVSLIYCVICNYILNAKYDTFINCNCASKNYLRLSRKASRKARETRPFVLLCGRRLCRNFRKTPNLPNRFDVLTKSIQNFRQIWCRPVVGWGDPVWE